MAYSHPVMILIFIKRWTDASVNYLSRRAQKASRSGVIPADVQRLCFRARTTGSTYPADTWVSTPMLMQC